MSPTVLLIGTLDTKGDEYAFLRDRLADAGVDVLLADVGTLEPPRAETDVRVRKQPLHFDWIYVMVIIRIRYTSVTNNRQYK